MDVEIGGEEARRTLGETILSVLQSRLGRQLGNARVDVLGRSVVLRGTTPSFYLKQLATHLTLPLIGEYELQNRIAVGLHRL